MDGELIDERLDMTIEEAMETAAPELYDLLKTLNKERHETIRKNLPERTHEIETDYRKRYRSLMRWYITEEERWQIV